MAWSDGFRRGAESAADLASSFDASSVHDYRLGDCILGKMNLRRRKPRRNVRRLTHPGDAWICGFVVALVGMYRGLIAGGDAAGVRRVAREAGLDLQAMAKAGVDRLDLAVLRRAGVPDRSRADA